MNDVIINHLHKKKATLITADNVILKLSYKNLLAKEKHKIKKIELKNFKVNLNLEKYIIICRSGHRSGKVSGYLNNQGFDTFNLLGGMQELSLTSENVIDSTGNKGTII